MTATYRLVDVERVLVERVLEPLVPLERVLEPLELLVELLERELLLLLLPLRVFVVVGVRLVLVVPEVRTRVVVVLCEARELLDEPDLEVEVADVLRLLLVVVVDVLGCVLVDCAVDDDVRVLVPVVVCFCVVVACVRGVVVADDDVVRPDSVVRELVPV